MRVGAQRFGLAVGAAVELLVQRWERCPWCRRRGCKAECDAGRRISELEWLVVQVELQLAEARKALEALS